MIQGIIGLLVNDKGIQDIVGHSDSGEGYNVFPVYVPPGETESDSPFITALITGVTPTAGRCISELDQVAVDVVSYASDYEVMDLLANTTRLVIDGFKSISEGVDMDVSFKTEYDTVEETTGFFARVQSYNVGVRRKINQPHALG